MSASHAWMSMPVAGLVPAERADDPADLVVRNGRIYTGDPRRPYAAAVAIHDGRVLAVGDDHGMARHVTRATRVVDAMGRRVIPGLIDAHIHVIRTGLHYLLELRWDGVRSLREALAILRDQASRTPPGQWVRVVGGWSKEQFAEQRLPTISELNAAAPDTPVMVTHLYQAVLLNRAALRAAGYTRDTPEVPGGQIVRDHDGEPTGVLLAAPAANLLYATIGKAPVLSEDGQLESTRHFLHELNRFGLTSAIDAAGGFQSFPEHYAAVTRLADRGALSVRLAFHLFPQVPGQELDDIRRWTAGVRPGDGDDWLRLNGAGEGLAWSAIDFENFAEPRPELPERAAASGGRGPAAGRTWLALPAARHLRRDHPHGPGRVRKDRRVPRRRTVDPGPRRDHLTGKHRPGCRAGRRHLRPAPDGLPGPRLHRTLRTRARRPRPAGQGHAGPRADGGRRYRRAPGFHLQSVDCPGVAGPRAHGRRPAAVRPGQPAGPGDRAAAVHQGGGRAHR